MQTTNFIQPEQIGQARELLAEISVLKAIQNIC